MGFKILGVSGSLRNARRGLGNESLIEDILRLTSQDELKDYITQEAEEHLKNFVEAGRKEKRPFDEMYRQLKKQKGNKGLSNSEIALTAALWSAKELGADIDHVSLSEYFKETNSSNNLEELKSKLVEADGILISTPVYFGDRSSLVQSLVDLIRNDDELKGKLKNTVYAGLAVGAKRNGGQETTLIYQLMDMVECGFLGVGNDSETTSQYGGTGMAGDIGTMPKDEYGLNTAMGTGRRIARVCGMLKMAQINQLSGKPKILFWILQDKEGVARETTDKLIENNQEKIDATILNLEGKSIYRCLACDICPIDIDRDKVYRCIIKSPKDDLKELHQDLLDYDAIVPVVYSPKDRTGLQSNYQQFFERTRYLRRGDYVFSDSLVNGLIIEDVDTNENMPIRIMTSMIRHHTIIAKPMKLIRYHGELINLDSVRDQFDDFANQIRLTAKARMLSYASDLDNLKYKPVGYVLSSQKDIEDENLRKRADMMEDRQERFKALVRERLE